MLKTFALSFRLRLTYKTNSIIWSLKGVPLLRRLLPSSLYGSRGLKTFAGVLGVIWEVLSAFSGKAVYLTLIYLLCMKADAPSGDSYAHLLIFLTLAGGLLNTAIFNPSKDKFYAMFILRMDAKQYTLTDYGYFLLKMLAGFLVFSPLFGALAGASLPTRLSVPVYVICVKLVFTALGLVSCKKQARTVNENKPGRLVWGAVALLLAAALTPYYLGFALSEKLLWILTAAALVPAGLALRYILRFDSYRAVYKELLRPENFAVDGRSASGAAQQLAMQKKISTDVSATSDKHGYKYFNELFMKRHAKLLTRSAKRIALVSAALLAAAVAALYISPEARPAVNELLMTYLPYFLFIMYLINRGNAITQAMFMNCDHSMLTYRFYRQPKALLSLFVERLKYVVLINLLPAAVIALGLPLLLYVTGGTDDPRNYAALFVSIIAMSVFFSVHHMVLYYLLQPYNVNLETKSAAYGIINWITYILCYMAIQLRLPTLTFGAAISAFCLIYAAAAFALAYRLAPKTFKLRQ